MILFGSKNKGTEIRAIKMANSAANLISIFFLQLSFCSTIAVDFYSTNCAAILITI